VISAIVGNVFVYGLLRGLASNLANKNRTCLPQAR
jgi:septum formation inhibitor MinC